MIRYFLLITVFLLVPLMGCQHSIKTNAPSSRSIAMLHIAPRLANELGDLDANTQTIATAMALAKSQGADWVMTPELALTGYKFKSYLGTQWIKPGVDIWTQQLQKVADDLDLVLFLSHLEQDPVTFNRHNTLFVIDRSGVIIGRHRKLNTLPGSESWSTPGSIVAPIVIDNINVGLLICADAWPQKHAQSLADQGANILLSSANWAPGLYGPGASWESRVTETGLTLMVNNRTGIEDDLDMNIAKSVVVSPIANDDQRVFEHQSQNNVLLMLDYDFRDQSLIGSRIIGL
jgi:predicted amidohydrolase